MWDANHEKRHSSVPDTFSWLEKAHRAGVIPTSIPVEFIERSGKASYEDADKRRRG
jgi:hypothetical protein